MSRSKYLERGLSMTPMVTHSQAKLATRLAFIAAGFGVACWAPLVPYAKARCQVDDGTIDLILLILAVGEYSP